MKRFLFRLARLNFGLFLYALGIVGTLNAKVGYAPWDVFHVGLANATGMSIGVASIVSGVFFVVLVAILGEKLGLGTLLNMVLIGVFIDILLKVGIIPSPGNYIVGLAQLLVSLFVIAFASFFYIGSGFGAGPRDSLMVALRRKTKLPVGVCRGAIELVAVLAGWRLGGMVGAGTVICAFGIGFCIQLVFRLLKFDPAKVTHETLAATFRRLYVKRAAKIIDARPEIVEEKT